MKKTNEQTTKQKAANSFIEQLENQVYESFEIQKQVLQIEFFAKQNDIWVYVEDIVKLLTDLREKYQFAISTIKEQTNESED